MNSNLIESSRSVGSYYDSRDSPLRTPDHNPSFKYRKEFRCSPTSGRTFEVLVPVEKDAPMPQDSFKFEWRCSPTSGRTWQVRVPTTPKEIPSQYPIYSWEWRVDPITGERFQIKVQLRKDTSFRSFVDRYGREFCQSGQHANSGSNVTRCDQSLSRESYMEDSVGRVVGAHQINKEEDYAASSHPPEISGINRMSVGYKKHSRLVEFAKMCPAKWAKQTTNASINLPLYTWGAVAELEAALSGRTKGLSEGELLGKLRHLKHIL